MNAIIAFVSDFGLDDTWVGVCHAAIHRACPQAHVVDLSHAVEPFDIRKGAAVAAAGVFQLPEAIHLVVVDPGVGGGRLDLCIRTRGGTLLVGPDNGVLMPGAERAGGVDEVWSIDPARLAPGGACRTFHARDILAPAAAALACGVEPMSLGDAVEPETLAPAPFGLARAQGPYVEGEVLEQDRFGSVRLNVPSEQIDRLGLRCDRVEVGLGHTAIEVPFRGTFADVPEGEPVLIVDASGWLTLALNTGSAADRYGIEPGMAARLRPIA